MEDNIPYQIRGSAINAVMDYIRKNVDSSRLEEWRNEMERNYDPSREVKDSEELVVEHTIEQFFKNLV